MIDDRAGMMPRRALPKYSYSNSATALYLGITEMRALEGCFGKWNIWYWPDGGKATQFLDSDPLQEPATLYLNSPTLVKGLNNDAPPGHATVTAFVPCRYGAWCISDPARLAATKKRHTELILNSIERRFIPRLKDYVGLVCLRTPDENERILRAPIGNIYGRAVERREVWNKLPFQGLLPNLYFVGSYVSFAGIASVIHGACRLYQEFTGDPV
jgi:phytoene dehydrogenase-like protein